MGSGLLSADTQIHTQPSETYAHTEPRFAALEMLPLLQISSLKRERPLLGRTWTGVMGGERKACIFGPPPRLQASGEGVGVGELGKGG